MKRLTRPLLIAMVGMWLAIAAFGMSQQQKIHHPTACSFYCMDSRIQKHALKFAEDYMRKKAGKRVRIDVGTCPGPNRALADNKKQHFIATLMEVLELAMEQHDAKILLIFGHADCAGNTDAKGKCVGKDEHVKHLHQSRQNVLRSPQGKKLEAIVLVWGERIDDDTWTFQVIE